MDDDLGLLPDPEAAPPPPRRPLGLLVGALVVVALLAVAGVFWMVASVSDRGGKVTAAGSASPPTTPAPATPVATVPPTTPPPTSAGPVRTATTAVTTPPAPKPTPKPTTAPVPTPRPVPTPTTPVAKLVRVPDVVGLRVQQAGTVLRAAGLRVQVIGGVQDPGRDDRRVTAQRPAGGAVVRAGSTVILVTNGT